MSMLHLHLWSSLLAAALILLVLALPKGTARHRLGGRVAVGAWAVAAASSFGLPEWGRLTPIHALTLLTLVMLPLGIRYARQGRIAAHRTTMLATAGGLLTAGFFAAVIPGRYLYGVLFA